MKTWVANFFLFALTIPTAAFADDAVEVVRGAAPNLPKQPQVAVDGEGAIHIVYGAGDSIRYVRSDDDGQTFTAPANLPGAGVVSLGMRRGPRIAAIDGALCVTAVGGKQGKGRDGDVVAWRSTDGGRTWAEPISVNDIADSAREGLHAMAAGPGGKLCCVWLDLRAGKTEVMASTSADGGQTWSKNTLVYRSPDGSVCECCHPSLAFDPKGRIFVQWRNSLSGARDMYVASSSDGGESFASAVKLGTGTWPLDACPMDGGAIAATTAGKFVSAWRREGTVYLLDNPRKEERLIGAGEQPWIAATEAGPFVIWVKKRGDAAYLLTPGVKEAKKLADRANDTVVAAGPSGRGPVVAVWEAPEGKTQSIRCQIIAN